MKKRTMKSLLAIMALVCLLLTSFTVTAAAAVSNSSEISPLYTGISRLTAGLDINDDGCAECSGATRTLSGYSVELTVKLQRDGITIKTWDNSGTGSLSVNEDYYVTPGHDYQVIVTATVKNSSGTIIETPSTKSVVVPYNN